MCRAAHSQRSSSPATASPKSLDDQGSGFGTIDKSNGDHQRGSFCVHELTAAARDETGCGLVASAGLLVPLEPVNPPNCRSLKDENP
ncbi:hypothetical protein N7532_005617 [Penicillium argentinense]|uniref:Uncharacterized protein n=1 Tax=Penicillium argentinense TaxID=1131581 RepID=A0A9W9FEA5_9EURO|nr:uncharacterized protein N7532_005617 [Penicillium argentinense]KAJ5098616.1 hypothetical protein N7532_005617 [Penicillium argentinense]